MKASTTYRMSCWYATSSNYNGSGGFSMPEHVPVPDHTLPPLDKGTLLHTQVVDGVTWEYRYKDITTPADFSHSFEWYVGYNGDSSTLGYRYLQVYLSPRLTGLRLRAQPAEFIKYQLVSPLLEAVERTWTGGSIPARRTTSPAAHVRVW